MYRGEGLDQGTLQRLSSDLAWEGSGIRGRIAPHPQTQQSSGLSQSREEGIGTRSDSHSLFARSLGTALREAGA